MRRLGWFVVEHDLHASPAECEGDDVVALAVGRDGLLLPKQRAADRYGDVLSRLALKHVGCEPQPQHP